MAKAEVPQASVEVRNEEVTCQVTSVFSFSRLDLLLLTFIVFLYSVLYISKLSQTISMSKASVTCTCVSVLFGLTNAIIMSVL